MPDGLLLALETPGLWAVVGASILAGLVYGFAGFGAMLVYMPIATIFIEPALAVAAASLSALISLVTVVPRAWNEADRAASLQLVGFSLLGMPVGLWALTTWDPVVLRWCVLAVVTFTLMALLAGWRRKTRETLPTRGAVGLATGTVGAATGLNGPVLVLFQLSSSDAAERSRANTIIFLTLNSILLLPVMWLTGALPPEAVWLGLILLMPYGAASLAGQALFTPDRAGLYRTVAYVVIAAAIVMGLPVWS
ncbi:MAG: sulfite exporter TauE/SafE family protein [Pseudomonadota bacterium]